MVKLGAGLGVFAAVVSIVLRGLDSERRPGLAGACAVLHGHAVNHITRGS
jgi:hypothetical protein